MIPPTRRVALRLAAYTLFWGWNLLLLGVLGMGYGPLVLTEVLFASARGLLPVEIALFAVSLLVLPALGCLLGLHPALRRDPGRLLSMFYGVQAPLMLLVGVRMFAIHELTAATGLALAVVTVGGAGLLRLLLAGPDEASPALSALKLAAASGYAVVGLWWAAVSALLFTPPLLHMVAGLPSFLLNLLRATFTELPLILPMLLLFALTAANLAVMPFAAVGVALRNLQLCHKAARQRWGAAATVGVLATAAAVTLGFVLAAQQPQAATFAQLRAAEDDAARRAIVDDLDGVRAGLLAAHLGPDRYLDADEGIARHGWERLVGETLATVPVALWERLLAPISYQRVDEGSHWSGRSSAPRDVRTAAELYAEVFDAPMARAERDALLRSARHTWSWRDAAAGLLDIGQQRVRLERQHLELEPHGDLATLRVHDVWRNQGFEREEIRLSFELPESAALTGLWLGDSDDRERAFRYVVAPRGAAQEVYESEVQRRVDPALLEQVGPRQYRLRAFPIEPRDRATDDVWSLGDEGPALHVFLELVVPAERGAFVPPRLTEARNAYWDARTARTVDGEPLADPVDSWLPASLGEAGPKQAHRATLGGWEVRAEPSAPRAARPLRVDVVVDSSRSMAAHDGAVRDALATLQQKHTVAGVLCTVEQRLQPCAADWPAGHLYWGQASPAEQLAAYAALERPRPDALVVLTDAGSYELLGGREKLLPEVELPPLWMLHLGGALPAAYPDWTADRIQRSGGGVVGDVETLLARMADPAWIDGWRVEIAPADPTALPAAPGAPFTPIAARLLIRSLAAAGRGELAELDAVHAVAVTHHIVTPWSSMLVLVNDRQRERLAEAERRGDRFEREITDAADAPELSGVPEPATWLLLALGGGLVAGAGRRRKG